MKPVVTSGLSTYRAGHKEALHAHLETPKPRRLRARNLDALEQIAAACVEGDAVRILSKRIDGLVYCVTRDHCECPGFFAAHHCYHQGLRKTVLWLLERLPAEGLTLDAAVANLRAAKGRGGCGAIDCSFCRRQLYCPRTARHSDAQWVMAACSAA